MFTIGVIGAGQFARHFMPLWKAHPLISEVSIVDVIPERAKEFAETFDASMVETTEQLLESDVDAVAIFAQRHLHGPLAIAALKAGKHVYSAVPMGVTVKEIAEIVDLVRETGLTYMMGETCYYFPAAIYCRQEQRKGLFGDFVYAQSQYIHDMDHGFYDAFRFSGGDQWERSAGFPPMYYPTHTVGPVVAATDSHVTRVSCFGYVDKVDDGVFGVGNNEWDNPFSNQVALHQLSNGGIHRVMEFRRAGLRKPGTHIGLYLGTKASYEFAFSEHFLQRSLGGEQMEGVNISELLNGTDLEAHRGEPGFVNDVANVRYERTSMSPIMPSHRLPASFEGIEAAHRGTHKFLVDDFAKAVDSRTLPPINAWESARYTIPGLISHESAMQGGKALDVPDLGDAPSDWTRLDPDD